MRANQFPNNRRNLTVIVMMGALCVLLCGTLAASFYVSHSITDELRENAYDSLMNASEIIRQNLDSSMQDDIELVSSFGEMLHNDDYRNLAVQLSEFCMVDKLLHVYYADGSGTGISETGERFTIGDLPVRETALMGVPSVSDGFVGETGQRHLLVQAPIFDGSDVVGALYAEVVATRYYSEDTFVFLGGEGRAALFNRTDGAFVIKAPQTALVNLKTDNIFEDILQSGNDAIAYDTIVSQVSSGAKSIVKMQYGSVSSFIAILPCKTNGDLYVATVVPQDALQVEARSISRLVLTMQVILILGLSGLIVIGSQLLYRMMREKQARKEREIEERSREELTAALVKAQEANAAKTLFLSNMSHDIRTPMNAIIGMAALAGQSIGEEEKLRDCLRVITSSSHHLLDLINDILEISRIESGNLELDCAPFALPVAVQSIISIITPLCKAKSQTFSTELHSIEHEYIIGDRTKVGQVLINLLNNANKFTPSGGEVRLVVEETPSDDADMANYRISVMDTGIGIPIEKQATVFDAFVRASNASSDKPEGTGLGLSIARSIVQAMGGSITLSSESGVGSCFTVTLSFPIQKHPSVADDYRALNGKRALIVDGEQGVCERACAYLADAGMLADFAVSVPRAVETTLRAHAEGRGYDIVVMDWNTGDTGGAEAVRRIRQAVGMNARIIVLTQGDWQIIEAVAHNAGANALLSKPLFQSSLLAKLLETMENQSLHRKLLATLTGKHVLLVEDNAVNQTVAKLLLEGAGASVTVANNGREGADAFAASPRGHYDAILMDIQMPVMNGYEATSEIRGSSHPDAATIPIIALTANAFAEDDAQAADAGMDAHLTKPVEPAALFTTLKRLMH